MSVKSSGVFPSSDDVSVVVPESSDDSCSIAGFDEDCCAPKLFVARRQQGSLLASAATLVAWVVVPNQAVHGLDPRTAMRLGWYFLVVIRLSMGLP